MIIKTYLLHEHGLKEKFIFTGELISLKLPEFFKDKDFGAGVTELIYREFSLKKRENRDYTVAVKYSHVKKRLTVPIDMNFETALQADNDQFVKYETSCYLEQSKAILDKKVPNFDGKEYLKELQEFFMMNTPI